MRGWLVALLSVLLLIVNCLTCTNPVLAQIAGGDQFLDGIGETALPASFSHLVGVPDITVETVAGYLPRLPYYIPGLYRDNAEGPMVRVIWPAPINNKQVSKVGTYTVTGTVPGTKFKPTATVSVKAAFNTNHVPRRNVEPFPLGQVVLNQYENGRDTPFIKNRDKFIRTLAHTK